MEPEDPVRAICIRLMAATNDEDVLVLAEKLRGLIHTRVAQLREELKTKTVLPRPALSSRLHADEH